MNSSSRSLAAAALFLCTAGCASGPALPPSIAPDAQPSLDGLYRVDNSVMQLAEAKRDLDLSDYAAFMISPVEVAYQKEPGPRTPTTMESNFALSATQMQALKDAFRDEIVRALTADDGYRLVEEPGPGVLRLDVYLIDLIVRFDAQATVGRNRAFTSSYGEVTMILELHDAESGEILARVAERADPTRVTADVVEVRPTFVRADVSRLFRHWAAAVRERLDQVRAADLSGGGS